MVNLSTTMIELEKRAEQALTATLRQMSGVNLKDMQAASAESHRPTGILARIDVFGHSFTLACLVEPDGELPGVREALDDLVKYTAHLTETAIPVVIAPCLSLQAQAACRNAEIGYLDFQGNARLFIGELFIGERSFPCRTAAGAPALTIANDGAGIIPQPYVRRPSRNRRNLISQKVNKIPALQPASSQRGGL